MRKFLSFWITYSCGFLENSFLFKSFLKFEPGIAGVKASICIPAGAGVSLPGVFFPLNTGASGFLDFLGFWILDGVYKAVQISKGSYSKRF